MKTFWLSSKKCLIYSVIFQLLGASLTQGAVPSLRSALSPGLSDQIRYRHWMKSVDHLRSLPKQSMGASEKMKWRTAYRSMLKEKSWMLRSAAIQTAPVFERYIGSIVHEVFPKSLKDPAQAVRLDAVTTLQLMKPTGWREWLKTSCQDPANFYKGRPLWGASAALRALEHERGIASQPKLSFQKRFQAVARR